MKSHQFGFGLVHGFGFANVLRELGLPSSGLARSLLSFNLGVEGGQLVIVGVLWPLLWWLNKQPWSGYVSQIHLVTADNIAYDGGPKNIFDPNNGYRDVYKKIWGVN